MKKTLPITQVRENLPSIVQDAQLKMNEYVITVKGKPAAILMSADAYESWIETNEILADLDLMKAIQQGEEDFKNGDYVDWEDLKKELGFKVEEHVSHKTHSTSSKRT